MSIGDGSTYSYADVVCLERKRSKIAAALDIIAKQAGVMKW